MSKPPAIREVFVPAVATAGTLGVVLAAAAAGVTDLSHDDSATFPAIAVAVALAGLVLGAAAAWTLRLSPWLPVVPATAAVAGAVAGVTGGLGIAGSVALADLAVLTTLAAIIIDDHLALALPVTLGAGLVFFVWPLPLDVLPLVVIPSAAFGAFVVLGRDRLPEAEAVSVIVPEPETEPEPEPEPEPEGGVADKTQVPDPIDPSEPTPPPTAQTIDDLPVDEPVPDLGDEVPREPLLPELRPTFPVTVPARPSVSSSPVLAEAATGPGSAGRAPAHSRVIHDPARPVVRPRPARGRRERPSVTVAPRCDDAPVGRFGPPTIGPRARAAEMQPLVAGGIPGVGDLVLDSGTLAGLELRAASARGSSHRYEGVARQDAYAVGATAERVVVAVADGVSAAPLSHAGAAAACASAVDLVGRRWADRPLDTLDPRVVMGQIASRVGPLAVVNTRAPLDPFDVEAVTAAFATTLVVMVAEVHDGVPGVVWLARVGDADARFLGVGGWRPLFPVAAPGAGSNVTRALPLHHHLAEGGLTRWPARDALVCFTDGIGKPLDDAPVSVGARLAEWWTTPPDPLEFALQVQFRRRSYDDDRTAVVLWPGAGAHPHAGRDDSWDRLRPLDAALPQRGDEARA